MAENNAVDAAILQLSATDVDFDVNAHFNYVIGGVTAYCASAAGDDVTSDESSRLFHVDPQSGELSIRISVDREKYSHFRVPIFAVDHGFPTQTGSTMVEVVVDDVNDEQPTFLLPQNATGNSNGGLEMSVSEDATDGKVVGHLRAVDRDATLANNRIYYSFRSPRMLRQSAKFDVDADTGAVRLRGRLDREHRSKYLMTAVATDTGSPALSAVKQLVVTVLDVNDNEPVFAFPSLHNSTVTVSASLPLGHQIARVVARDRDSGRNGRATYRLPSTGDNIDDKFQIQRQHGVVYINFRFDHVTYAEYRLTVVAEDDGIVSRSATAQLVVVVNRSIPFPLPAWSRDPEVVHYNVAIISVGVLTSAVLVGVVMLIIVAFDSRRDGAQDTRQASPLSSVSTNYLQTQQFTDITPRSSTVRIDNSSSTCRH